MRFGRGSWRLLFFALSVAAAGWCGAAQAAGGNPFIRQCADFASAEEFVKEASYYCLKQANTRLCDKHAVQYFEQCGFAGSFQTISSRVHRNILMLYLIGNTPPFISKQERRRAARRESARRM